MRHLFIGLVRLYQFFISPYFPTSCRYYPTCSHYAIDAFKTHGVLKGFTLAAWRVLRCNPWSEGGEDPVPGKKEHCSCHPDSSESDTRSNTNTDTRSNIITSTRSNTIINTRSNTITSTPSTDF